MEINEHVPKTIVGNLRFRQVVLERAASDPAVQRVLLGACRRDILFFFNTFVWLYEPRPRYLAGKLLPKKIPFVTYPHQDKAIRQIVANLGTKDIGIEKARGEGASWIAVMLALHAWLFEPYSLVGMVSSTEKKADNPENPDSLFWKIDWQLKQLPPWMAGVKGDWTRNTTDHTLVNHRNESRIVAFSAVGGVGRGGRYAWFLMDEMAEWDRGRDKRAMMSTQQATNSRLVISTPCGSEGEYYEFMHRPSSVVKVTLDWRDNPARNRGLYTYVKGKCVPVSPSNPLPVNYAADNHDLFRRLIDKGFVLEGTTRSPWYDGECDRPDSTPTSIAQELDRDYGGSKYRVFRNPFFVATKETIRKPVGIGEINYNRETLESGSFEQVDNGPLRIWFAPDSRGQPPTRQYVIGADVSTGLGGVFTSNSSAHAFDVLTREQVLEYTTNIREPGDFADDCIALAKWLNNAHLAWEHNGPGTAFTKRVLSRQYQNIYRRKVLWRKGNKHTSAVGWWTDNNSKEAMFDEFQGAVKSGDLILRSKELVFECSQYIRQDGKIVHDSEKGGDDSVKGKAHGDRVIGACVAYQAMSGNPLFSFGRKGEEESARDPPRGTLAWRMKMYKEMDAKREDEWDDRTLDDIAGGKPEFDLGELWR